MYYHASQISGIKVLEPRVSNHNTPLIYFSTKRENVLVYLSNAIEKHCKETGFAHNGKWHKWASYGFEADGTLRLDEYYPNAIEDTYKGVSGYIYSADNICENSDSINISNAVATSKSVEVTDVEVIEDAYSEILKAADAGLIKIRRYEDMSDKMLAWIENAIKSEYEEAENEPDYRHFLKSKFDFIKKQETMLAEQALKYEDLIEAFRDIGIESGSILEVHSSLSSFGCVEGGVETVIRALKDAVGTQGSIFMPALRLSPELPLTEEDKKLGISVKIKILPEKRERSAMGIIADTFRLQSDTVTGDGIFQISGWGKNADKATNGGLDFAIHNGGMALLLGVDIYKLTAMHYVEDAIPNEINKMFANDENINDIYPQDEWFVETKHPAVKPWYTIQTMAYEKGLIKEGCIGKSKYMYFNIFDVVSLYKQELENNPYKLYGLE